MLRNAILVLFMSPCALIASAQASPDLTSEPTLYVVGYAHLDTQWRWEYPQTILEFLPSTMHENFRLFEKYPHYIFNFGGANRYRMMKEYYPEDYDMVRRYVRSGRWFPSGSSLEETDVNSPSAESTIRNVLYGNQFYRREFGKASAEFMLPDSFGFPSSLPTILAHCGLKGFSTQKLTWGSAAPVGGDGSPQQTPEGIPFNIGLWEGPDGSAILAAFHPGSYSGDIWYDLSRSASGAADRGYIDWPKRVQRNGETGGVFADYHYYGVGDVGGAPREPSVALLEAIVTGGPVSLPSADSSVTEVIRAGQGPLRVVSATAEQMFLDIRPEQWKGLLRYQGELELTNHSAGSLTSQAAHKQWNRDNELLADAAERASAAAFWLGTRRYPVERLNEAWRLVIGGQFHDNAAGTSTPKAYEYTWNDDLLAMNQFSSILTSATEAIVSAMDTTVEGRAVVVYNPLAIEREDVVEATISLDDEAIRVIGPEGTEVPSQLVESKDGQARILFLARAPSTGYAVYDLRRGGRQRASSETLRVTTSTLENARYRIRVNETGDISSIFDKKLREEILSSPLRLEFLTEDPRDWPAWNMDWEDRQRPPRARVTGPATIRVVESGPVRIALEITRETERSRFTETIRLSAGDAGNRIEIENRIDWNTPASSLKAAFPLRASNPVATYNWGVGTIERDNNDARKFEVASHEWIDLTDRSGSHGVTVLTGSRYGSDKPDDRTLRLTLLYTPGLGAGNGRAYADQTSQDWGSHRFLYGLASHAGDWRREETDWHARRLDQPLIAFESAKHDGPLGKRSSFLTVSDSRVRVMALKKAEESDELVVRLVELDGEGTGEVAVSFAAAVIGAREIDGQERSLAEAAVADGNLILSLTPYSVRSFAVRLAPPTIHVTPPRSRVVDLPYDRRVATLDGVQTEEGFDDDGRSLPAVLLPRSLAYGGIEFALAPASESANAVVARGQTIELPPGYSRIYVLAAGKEDREATFLLGDERIAWNVQAWNGYVGQWDNRIWIDRLEDAPPREGAPPGAPSYRRKVTAFGGLTPAFVKPAPVAWYASHHHDANGANHPYAYSYLFAYQARIPEGAKTLTLPDDDSIRVLAVTLSDEGEIIERLGSAPPRVGTGSIDRDRGSVVSGGF